MNRSLFVSAMTLSVVLLAGLMLPFKTWAADACHDQWVRSSAYQKCDKWMSVEEPKGVCNLTVACDDAQGVPGAAEGSTWTLGSVSKLVNNNGKLTGGVVPTAPAPAPAPAPSQYPLPKNYPDVAQ